MKKHAFGWELTALILLIIGGINWGFIGLFDWDMLAGVFGANGPLVNVVYGVIGLGALYRILIWLQSKKA